MEPLTSKPSCRSALLTSAIQRSGYLALIGRVQIAATLRRMATLDLRYRMRCVPLATRRHSRAAA